MKNITFKNKKLIPGKIVCVGRNYVEHIEELGNEIPENLVIFLKPNSSITSTLPSSHLGESLHYEGEISFLFEKGRFSAVAFGLDLTKRDLQARLKEKGLPWERAKSFDGAAIFSDFIPFGDDFSALTLELKINDKRVQFASTEFMMYKPDNILKEIQKFMTLDDGDIVMTGTPKGVGIIHSGDNFRGEILENGHSLVKEIWTAV
jgi:2-keto-4-pentenoate hydratase/2-oxohepta-3-ene-1,7-dioic acid hydratase in catechol pathway